MKKESKIIAELKKKVEEQKKTIQHQENLIEEYKHNHLLNLFNSIEAIINEYSILLHPPAVKVKSSFKNLSEEYKVQPENIIGIFSVGRRKDILMNRMISGTGSNERDTDVIYYDGSWENLIPLLGKNNILLCQIDRGTFINVNCYNLLNNELVCDWIINENYSDYSVIPLSKKHKQEFIEKKSTFMKIFSLQNLLVRYKLRNGFPI